MLATSGFTPLLVNLESIATNPERVGAVKTPLHGKLGRSGAILYIQGKHGFFYGLKKTGIAG